MDAIPLPEGCRMKVFGEQESQQESNEALAANMPLTLVLIFVVLLLLFRNYREPAVILLMIPLVFIGGGARTRRNGQGLQLLLAARPAGPRGHEREERRGARRAHRRAAPHRHGARGGVVAAARSRIVPVALASGTTILGMLPLLFDSMFGAMAATIMGGLLMATLLTICVLPVVYALFYRIRP